MLGAAASGGSPSLGPTEIVSAVEQQPVFRAVTTPKERRGIRLESLYWDILKSVAKAGNRTLGEQIEHTIDGSSKAVNVASLLRVACVKWLIHRIAALEDMASLRTTDAIIQASPSPAFALTADRRILLHNRAMLSLIQSRFLALKPDVMQRGLRLSLDVQIEQVIGELTRGSSNTVVTGFVLGIEGQRIRGNLNMVLAPVSRQTVIIAYIASA